MSQPPIHRLLHTVEKPVSFTVQAPATTANLGPGYDCLGLALEFRDTVSVQARPRRRSQQPQLNIQIEGQGAASIPADASHLVINVIESLLRARGYALPDLEVHALNKIPHSRGLGSSAAAVVTAVVIADQLLPAGLSLEEQFQIGSQVEGHPDNYAPALFGGIRLSWTQHSTAHIQEQAQFGSVALTPHQNLRVVAAIPEFTQSTAVARQLLPEQISHRVAAAQAARVGLLVHALTTDPEQLFIATEDWLHQEYRRSAFAASMALVDQLRGQGLAAVISGAGPAVLVLGDESSSAEALERITQFNADMPQSQHFAGRKLPIALTGATVEAMQDHLWSPHG